MGSSPSGRRADDAADHQQRAAGDHRIGHEAEPAGDQQYEGQAAKASSEDQRKRCDRFHPRPVSAPKRPDVSEAFLRDPGRFSSIINRTCVLRKQRSFAVADLRVWRPLC